MKTLGSSSVVADANARRQKKEKNSGMEDIRENVATKKGEMVIKLSRAEISMVSSTANEETNVRNNIPVH